MCLEEFTSCDITAKPTVILFSTLASWLIVNPRLITPIFKSYCSFLKILTLRRYLKDVITLSSQFAGNVITLMTNIPEEQAHRLREHFAGMLAEISFSKFQEYLALARFVVQDKDVTHNVRRGSQHKAFTL